MKKLLFSLAVLTILFGTFNFALAAPSSTPEEFLTSTVDAGLNGSMDVVSYVMTNYWKYILVFVVIISLLILAKRFSRLGSR